jgi:ATP-binding cassette subfamily B protein
LHAGEHRRAVESPADDVAKPKVPRSGLRAMLGTFRLLGIRYVRRRIALVSLFSFIAGGAQAALLILLSQVGIDAARGNMHYDIEHVNLSFGSVILVSLGLVTVYFGASLVSALTNSAMSASALEGSRMSMIKAFFGADWATQSSERLGHVQQLLTMQCVYVANVAGGLASGAQALLGFLTLILAAFIISPVTASAVLIVGVAIFLVLRPFNTWSRRTSARVAAETETMATLVTEYTRLTREFRVLGVTSRAVEYMRECSRQTTRAFHRGRQIGQLVPAVYQTLALLIVILSFGIFVAHHGSGLAGVAAVLLLILRSLTYGAGVQGAVQQLSEFEGVLASLRVEFERLAAHAEHEVEGIRPIRVDLECRDVWFSYDDRTAALKGVSFSLPEGSSLAVVGRSGSGKTTLSQIILGLRNPSSGLALVGGVESRDVAKQDGSSSVALVPQEPVLLHTSIASNIAFFRDVSVEEITAAAKAAHFEEEILAMPNGYETLVGEGGGSISGGQRQRLAIARALVGKPNLLVLDEPTSALDGQSESSIARTLSELRGQVTVVVISHRPATIDDCDFLLVLDEGRVVDFGAREEVRNRQPLRPEVGIASP